MKQHISDKQLSKFFKEHNLAGAIHYHTTFRRRIRYITINNNCNSTLLFIHGSPASLIANEEYFTDPGLRQAFNMIAVDRPGYGRSGYGDPEPSIKKQAEIVKEIIEECSIQRPFVVYAASYGASIACRLLMDFPLIADGLVLVAPSLSPGEEKYFWITPLIEHSFIRKIIPPHHRTSNTEKFYHKDELSKMLPYWKNIRVPVMYIQGEKDKMIYTTNAGFVRKNLLNVPSLEVNFIKGQKHVIDKKENPFIIKKILELFKQAGQLMTEGPNSNCHSPGRTNAY
ncbi:MAG TPA: alpha/beta hydrolase [Chitinophagaceae bacterium]|jgi:pimeloyl-ACP methyl ester carboxylesterase|nr:alpha/beta hydrolase [Chitinophagaceae bacterium]